MRKLLSSFLLVFMLAAVIVPVAASSKVYAAASHPLVAPCTSNSLNQTTSVNVPSGNETWICANVAYYDGSGNFHNVPLWTAQIVSPNPSFWTNHNSGMEMDVIYGTTNNGAQIIQWPYNGQANQQWDMIYNQLGVQNVVNTKSGLCLGVQGGSLGQGAAVVQWTCNGHYDQDWTWAWTGKTSAGGWPIWHIIDFNSSMCLGIAGASTTAAAHAVQWGCNGSADQEWL